MGRSVDEPVRLRGRPPVGAHCEPRALELVRSEQAVTDAPPPAAARPARLDTRELQRIAEQQERVLADVRASLEQFRQRSAKLAKDYVRILARPPVTTLGRTRR